MTDHNREALLPEYASVTFNGRTETFRRGELGYELVMLSIKSPAPVVADEMVRDALVEAKRQAAMDAAWGFRHETRSALEKWTAQHWFDTGWRACAAALTSDGQEKNR